MGKAGRKPRTDDPVQLSTRVAREKLDWLNEWREGVRGPGRPTYPQGLAIGDAIDALKDKVEG